MMTPKPTIQPAAALTLLLLLSADVFQLPAQQPETNRKQFDEVNAKVEAGDAYSEYRLGLCYYNGLGVAKDDVEAVKWWRKAAEQGFAKAQYNLGVCYANGLGVAKDDVEAVKWWSKAAEQNDAHAQDNLGHRYANGRGVAKDYVEAVKWWRKAAEQGFAKAQYNLGVSYYNGQGVKKDHVQGYKWWLLAAAQGNEDAKRAITILENQMTREQVAEGQKLSRNFKPQEARHPLIGVRPSP